MLSNLPSSTEAWSQLDHTVPFNERKFNFKSGLNKSASPLFSCKTTGLKRKSLTMNAPKI